MVGLLSQVRLSEFCTSVFVTPLVSFLRTLSLRQPPSIALAATTTTQASGLLDGVVRGVLGGSVAFADPTSDNTHAGPRQADNVTENTAVLGIFINNAVSNAFENQPGVASNRGPYVSANLRQQAL